MVLFHPLLFFFSRPPGVNNTVTDAHFLSDTENGFAVGNQAEHVSFELGSVLSVWSRFFGHLTRS